MVLADGSFATASESENSDLLWALRGGGGNFGVVSSFLFRTHPAKMVLGGPIIFDLSDAAVVMRWYREFLRTALETFGSFLGLQTVPPNDPFPREHWGKKMSVLLLAHTGDTAAAAIDAVRAALPKPLIDWVGPLSYPALQGMFDTLNPPGMQWTGRATSSTRSPTPRSTSISPTRRSCRARSFMHLYPIDGIVHRTASDATAWGARDATWSIVIAGIDRDPAKAAS